MITVTINLRLTAAEEADLTRILRKEEDWPNGFATYAVAAAEEYARMFLGQKIFTRGSDIREYRLFLLIRTAFNDAIPDEQTVCALFQCTLSQSRALLRAVMSKYQYQLSRAISDTLKRVIESARRDADQNDVFVFTVNNEIIVAELNKLLAEDPRQTQITRQAGTLGTYELKPAAYNALRERFNVRQGR